MPRLYGTAEKRARIVAVRVGCAIPSMDDQTTVITSLALLPSKDYRPPGHPDRQVDPGPMISVEIGGKPGYLAAPALVHMDRYSMRHYSTIEASQSFGAAAREMLELARTKGLPLVDGNGEPVQPAEFFWRCRATMLETRPVIVPIRQAAYVRSSAPYDGTAILEVIYTRDAC